MSNTINLYWSTISEMSQPFNWNILHSDPISVYKEKINRRTGDLHNSFFRCPSFKSLTTNTFVVSAPLTSHYTFEDDGSVSYKEGSLIVKMAHDPSVDNELLFDYHMPMFFFADQEVELTLTAPYFHQAPHLKYGAIVPGRLNIGSWFRSLSMEFNLWEGVKEFSVTKGEPIAYFSVNTDKKIKLHRFQTTPELQEIAFACSTAGNWEPRIPLADRYKRFRAARLQKHVLRLIQENEMK